mmetsp:Transcript_31786/g.68642  ORF Transcript_31786/g.68642 Transcript_31786/m.68642 type:complete len:280 (-) Transcript_31786:942-1781(-)
MSNADNRVGADDFDNVTSNASRDAPSLALPLLPLMPLRSETLSPPSSSSPSLVLNDSGTGKSTSCACLSSVSSLQSPSLSADVTSDILDVRSAVSSSPSDIVLRRRFFFVDADSELVPFVRSSSSTMGESCVASSPSSSWGLSDASNAEVAGGCAACISWSISPKLMSLVKELREVILLSRRLALLTMPPAPVPPPPENWCCGADLPRFNVAPFAKPLAVASLPGLDPPAGAFLHGFFGSYSSSIMIIRRLFLLCSSTPDSPSMEDCFPSFCGLVPKSS